MDTNKPTSQPANPVEQPTSVQAPVKSSMNMMLVVPLIIIVVAIIAGAFWFMTGGKTDQYTEGAPKSPAAQTASSGLEQELNSIDIESNDPDFADVDRDLQSL